MAVEIFNYETTYKTDYHGLQNVVLKHAKKPITYSDNLGAVKNRRPQVLLDNETYSRIQKPVPFDLFHKSKPSVTTDPRITITKPILPETKDKCREIRRTRPRVYMAPQVCVDDIPEDTMYGKGGFVDSIYTSEWEKAVEITNLPVNPIPEVYINIKEKADPMRYTPMYPVVPIRVEIKPRIEEWEKMQKRYNYVNPKNLCLQNRMERKAVEEEKKPKNRNFNKIVTDDEVANLKQLLKEDCLRQAFDKQIAGYAGHVSEHPIRMNPRAKRFNKVDQLLTNYQVNTGVYQRL